MKVLICFSKTKNVCGCIAFFVKVRFISQDSGMDYVIFGVFLDKLHDVVYRL